CASWEKSGGYFDYW
nr:immunoglobulin heavy chain junction region [Mus musculus]